MTASNRLTFLDRLHHPDVLDRHRINGQRILVEDDEVGELADFERTFAAFLEI